MQAMHDAVVTHLSMEPIESNLLSGEELVQEVCVLQLRHMGGTGKR